MNKNTGDGELDALVRDLTKVLPMSKSETRQRIQKYAAQEANKAQLAIVERILEAGEGKDFVNQMANAVGELAKVYTELTKEKESSDE